jgi:RNA polymerase sigma-70 factor (ECF subfamily)
MAGAFDQLNERMLIARCQAGDHVAFEEIVARYQPRLTFYVGKLVRDSGIVDDLLQDIWLDVFRSFGKLADPAAFPAWIYRIARDRAYRQFRRPREPTAVDADQLATPTDEASFSPEEIEDVYECMDALTDEHREVLVLRFLEDMSYDDIAAVTSCNVGTVRSRLHYAKATLRAAINRRNLR